MAVLDALDRFLDFCGRVFLAFAEICLVVMLTANMANIIARAVFDKGIVVVFPWTVVLFVWMVFFGFFPIYRSGKDITVDFVVDRLGPTSHRISRLLVDVVSLGVAGVFLLKAPATIAGQLGMIEMVGLPRYSLSIPLFLSCGLIFLNFALDAARALIPGADNGGHLGNNG